MDNFLNSVKNLFGVNNNQRLENKKIVSPVAQNEQLTNPALLNWYANQQSREALARRQNAQEQGMHNYVSPTPTVTPTPAILASAVQPTPWNKIATQIINEGNKRGYSGETLARQMANESGFGTSHYAQMRNNYGGIGAYDSNPDAALKFDSPEEYLNYYFNLVQKHYPEAYNNRANPQRYMEGLKQGGYASNPNYVEDVLNTSPYK